MKKIIILSLVLVLCFGILSACGKTAEPQVPASPTDAPAEPAPAVSGSDIAEPSDAATDSDIADSDLAYIVGKGKMTIGYTVYEPMNYTDEQGNFTGFDTELAIAVCEKLGVEPDFVEIDWLTKETELNAKSIDCIWNGLTIDAERAASMSLSVPYVKNAQVIVVKADSGFTSTADLVGKTVVAELGSAGETQIIGNDDAEPNADLAQAEYVGKALQTECLLEVKAGTADAAVLDWTLAKSTIGEGTDYAELMMIPDLQLAEEEYGIAFRKGSDATEKVNTILKDLVADGMLTALAEKYGLSLAPALEG